MAHPSRDFDAEARIRLFRRACLMAVVDMKIQFRLRGKSAKPCGVVLDRMGTEETQGITCGHAVTRLNPCSLGAKQVRKYPLARRPRHVVSVHLKHN